MFELVHPPQTTFHRSPAEHVFSHSYRMHRGVLSLLRRPKKSLQRVSRRSFYESMSRSGPIVLPAVGNHKGTLIFLHGLGDSGHGWEDVGVMVQNACPGVKVVLPHAPARPITLNGHVLMPGWYDIAELSDKGTSDVEGLEDTKKIITGLIEKEINEAKIPSHKIILGGFSQGAASSLYAGLQLNHQLAGIIALSGYLPLPKAGDTSSITLSDSNKSTPILMCHGDADQVVRFSWGKKSLAALQSILGENAVDFHVYPGMAHSACMEEIQEIISFVRKTILTDKL